MNILSKYNVPVEVDTQPRMEITMEGYKLVGEVHTEVSMESTDLTPEDKRVGNQNHTLFVKRMVDANGVSYDRYRLFLGTIAEQGSSFNDLINPLYDAKPEDQLELRILSPGGSIDFGMLLVNIINNEFLGRVTAVLDSSAASMASSVFVNCTKRICYPHSSIMFHNYWTGAYGKGQEITANIEHNDKRLVAIIYEHTVARGFLTEDEFNRLQDGKDYWFDYKEMLKRGIATHVMFAGHDIEGSEFLSYLEQGISGNEILRLHLEKKHPGETE